MNKNASNKNINSNYKLRNNNLRNISHYGHEKNVSF